MKGIILRPMFYLTGTPCWLKALFPRGLTWQGNTHAPALHLTFDDGPHPEITGWVAEQLRPGGHKASFFCIGENVARYPWVVPALLAEGHTAGNHTMRHPNGWETSTEQYLQEIRETHLLLPSRLFRPPYGKITRAQVAGIRSHFPAMQIVMWSAVTGDFDTQKTGTWCGQQAIRFARPGSIIVFHDSEKAFPRLKTALPMVLDYMHQHGLVSLAL